MEHPTTTPVQPHLAPDAAAPHAPLFVAPRFYVTPRQPFRPDAILLAILIAGAAFFAGVHALQAGRSRHFRDGGRFRPGHAASGDSSKDDDDDPASLETIYLGDPADAPVPATRAKLAEAAQPHTVHPFVVVRLPRSGDREGLIPDTPAGRLLYAWLAAFNKADEDGIAAALPSAGSGFAAAAQMELRKQTGGFTLLSSREVQPGVLVFRVHDQTPSAAEALGTLQVRPNSSPAGIASFSLRVIPPAPPSATAGAGPSPAAASR